jgi:hypothetical protein
MSRTEPGVKESYNNYTQNLDDYEYMISVRPGQSFETKNGFNRYAFNQRVIDEMYQDGLLCPFVYMSLHRENEEENNRPGESSFPYVLFFLYLLLLFTLYAYSP